MYFIGSKIITGDELMFFSVVTRNENYKILPNLFVGKCVKSSSTS